MPDDPFYTTANNFKSLNKEPICFKNPNNPSCIDLFITNGSRYFQNTSTIETGIWLVVKVLKMFYEKQKPKIIQYRNYKTFSILPVLSKIYARCIFDQMYSYVNHILSKHQCRFRLGHITQQSLLLMAEKLKKNLDNSGVGGMLLTDLPKAFDCLRHDLLIAKIAAYGFHFVSFLVTSQTEHRGLK